MRSSGIAVLSGIDSAPSPSRARDRLGAGAGPALALAALALAQATQVGHGRSAALGASAIAAGGHGRIEPFALLWLGIGLACLVAAFMRRVPLLERIGADGIRRLLAAGAIVELAQLARAYPGASLALPAGGLAPLRVLLAGAMLVVAAGLLPRGPFGRARLAALLVVHLGAGVWMIGATPMPPIDVFAFHKVPIAAFLHGDSPYAGPIPNLYGSSAFYGQGTATDSRVLAGYPYMPLTFVVAALSELCAGDYRYATLAAMTGSGALIAALAPSWLRVEAAAAYLFAPRVLWEIEVGWNEPLLLAALAGVALAVQHGRRGIALLLGLALAGKQYAVLLAPIATLAAAREGGARAAAGLVARAALVAAAVTLPFALWDAESFLRSAVLFHLRQPPRPDAVTFGAGLALAGLSLPAWLGPLAAFAVGAWLAARGPRGPAAFAAGSALVLCALFALAAQAFLNYYHLVVGLLCAAVAAHARDMMAPNRPSIEP